MKLIPLRPRVLPEVVLHPVEDGVLVDGLGKLQMFRGPLAQTVLPELLAATDGSRTLEELVDAFPDIASKDIHRSLELLAESGMLQASVQDSYIPEHARNLVSFLQRSLALSTPASACDAYRQLGLWRIRILPSAAMGTSAEQLLSLLRSLSISSAEVTTPHKLLKELGTQPRMVVALTDGVEDEQRIDLLEREREKGSLAWLRVKVCRQSHVADIGPLFVAGNESCYACFQRVHGLAPREADSAGLRLSNPEELFLAFLALEIFSILADPAHSIGAREFRRFNLSDLSARTLYYPRARQCPFRETHPSLIAGEEPLDRSGVIRLRTANVFEQYVGLESRRQTPPAGWEDPDGVMTPKTQPSKSLQRSKEVELGSVALDLGLTMPSALSSAWMPLARTLRVQQLGTVLALTAGIREQNGTVAKRWSATAGNLGSPEIYVLVHSVDGLEKGLYFYQSGAHTLALFEKRNALAPDQLMRRLLPRHQKVLPNALVLLTGAFHRLKKKYAMFGYRLLNLDAGVALSQLQMVARTLGFGTRIAALLPDDLLERELNLYSYDEQSTAAVELFARDTAGLFYRSFQQKSCDPVMPHSADAQAPESFADLSVSELTEMLFKESRIAESLVGVRPNKSRMTKPAADENVRECIRLPHPVRKGLSVGEVLKTRRSIRKFGSKPVPIDAISTALYHSDSEDAAEWPSDRNARLRFLVLACRVSGVPRGVYEFKPHAHELSLFRSGVTQEEIAGLLVQDDFADAPCIVWISGNVDEACRMYGAAGHRRLLLRAGAAGHRVWMAALGLGLGGTMIAGLVPGAARQVIGLNGFDRASLFAVALGYESGVEVGA